jgi:hypothetical protein
MPSPLSNIHDEELAYKATLQPIRHAERLTMNLKIRLARRRHGKVKTMCRAGEPQNDATS